MLAIMLVSFLRVSSWILREFFGFQCSLLLGFGSFSACFAICTQRDLSPDCQPSLPGCIDPLARESGIRDGLRGRVACCASMAI